MMSLSRFAPTAWSQRQYLEGVCRALQVVFIVFTKEDQVFLGKYVSGCSWMYFRVECTLYGRAA